jgi:hypothetical protein
MEAGNREHTVTERQSQLPLILTGKADAGCFHLHAEAVRNIERAARRIAFVEYQRGAALAAAPSMLTLATARQCTRSASAGHRALSDLTDRERE